jgi:predicted TIM-barrel fold metal-dependent hydrolase
LGRPPAITPNPLNFDLAKRLEWMDAHGVQMAVLTLNGGMPWQWVPPEVGAHIAQVVNDAAIKTHTAFPDRFMAGIELSIRSPELALKELDRVAGKPGLRAVHLPNSIEGHDYFFDPAYAPLLARCEELGYPLLFHPLDGEANYYGGKQRLGDQLAESARLSNTLGFHSKLPPLQPSSLSRERWTRFRSWKLSCRIPEAPSPMLPAASTTAW